MNRCKLCSLPIVYWKNPDFCCQNCLDNFHEQEEFVPKIKNWLTANGYNADTFLYAHDGVGWVSGWSIVLKYRCYFSKRLLSEIYNEMLEGKTRVTQGSFSDLQHFYLTSDSE
jgi:hypothetical protein